MKPKVIFRADGDSKMGMGHIVRCLALADMLKNNFEINFATQSTDDSSLKTINEKTKSTIRLPKTSDFNEDAANFLEFIDPGIIVVLDGYNFKTDYLETLKAKNCKLVYIDDLIAWHQVADVIINYSDGVKTSDYSKEPYTKIYAGLKYALLRKAFLNSVSSSKTINSVRKVFVSMGAADINNLSLDFSEALSTSENITEIHLMIGSVNLNLDRIRKLEEKKGTVKIVTHVNISDEALRDVLLQCDVAICPASTISLECCATGIGLISGYTAKNQMGILRSLNKYEAAVDFGNFVELDKDELSRKLSELFRQPEIFNRVITNQRNMIDGNSPHRLLAVFNKLEEQKLHFRLATSEDVDLYFEWSTDPLVRSNSFNQNQILYDDHVKWFQTKLDSENCFLYIFLNLKNEPVGQVRIEKVKDEVLVGISIDKKFRGKSFGVEMIESASNEYLQSYPNSVIFAYVKTENEASSKIFLKAGFEVDKIRSDEGYIKYKFLKNFIRDERY